MSCTLGLFVCPPPTTRAPRTLNDLGTPKPALTATSAVLGGATSVRSRPAKIS
jgi:hypothetical protein